MEARKLLDIIEVCERLKDTTRHCYTRNGRHESVAEHSWMMTLMAFFMRDEFKDVDRMSRYFEDFFVKHMKWAFDLEPTNLLEEDEGDKTEN